MKKEASTLEPDHISEARRYLDNAREILSQKAGKSGGFYADRKYVRMAGNTAWNGVLEAVNGAFSVKDKKSSRVDVKDYQQIIGKRSQTKLKAFNNAYDTLHKAMGYDGNLNVSIVQTGLKLADELVDWSETIR